MNTEYLNFHSHDPKAKILSLSPQDYVDYQPLPGQKLTVGIHPWDTVEEQLSSFEILARAFSDPNVVAIGEVGIDPLRGTDIERQKYILITQIKYAVDAGIPIVLHIVRRYDILLSTFRQYRPAKPWALHGFRGKPEVVRQLSDAGIYMSVGKNFNRESVKFIPDNLILVETDDLPLDSIVDIVKDVAEVRGVSPENLAQTCSRNLRKFYNI